MNVHGSSDVLFRFARGELDGELRDAVVRELSTCAECRAVVGALARHSATERGAAAPVPFTRDARSMAPPPRLSAGARLGDYRIEGVVGEGGMGVVYEVEHVLLGRRFALKVLHPGRDEDAAAVRRLGSEARAMSSLGHPGIVEVVDLGLDAERPFLVMELLRGETLQERLRRDGRLSISLALTIAHQLAEALAVAHRNGVVHRDVKPSNVFLGEREGDPGWVKLCDFGLAKLRSDDGGGPTQSGAVLGTPRYMAPEQWGEARHVDARADVFAWGVTAYAMLAGALPFETAIASAGDRVELRKVRAEVPLELALLVEACLSHAPAGRPSSAEVLLEKLTPIMALTRWHRDRPPSHRPPPQVVSPLDPTVDSSASSMSEHRLAAQLLDAPPEALHVAQVLAVLGAEARTEVATDDLLAMGIDEPGPGLSWLRDHGVIAGGQLVAPRFCELALDLLPEGDAARLHHGAAVLGRHRSQSVAMGPEAWATLGRQHDRAGEDVLASDAYARAALGARARDVLTSRALPVAPGELGFARRAELARRALDTAARASVRRDDAPELTLAGVDALVGEGRWNEALEQLRALDKQHWPPSAHARALVEEGTCLQRTGDHRAALALFGRAEALATPDASVEAVTLALALGRHAVSLAFAGQLEEARDRLWHAEEHVLQKAPERRADLAGWKAQVAGLSGDLGGRRDAYWAAVELFRADGNARFAAFSLLNLGDTYSRLGAYDEAERALRRARAECDALGAATMTGYAALNLGYALQRAGKPDEAHAHMEEARRIAEDGAEARLSRYVALYIARLAREQGLPLTETQRDALRTDEVSDHDPAWRALAEATLADDARARDALDQAVAHAEAAHRIVEDADGIEEGEADVALTVADVLEAAGHPERARRVVKDAAARLTRTARKIAGAHWRARFLEDVPSHRALLARSG